MACGTGKTKVARWVAERLVPAGGVVVIVAPTVGLVDQTLRVWAAEHDDHTALAVCSDQSVNDDSSARTTDILERVTTDPEVIAAWLRAPSSAGLRLIVGTHVSSHIIGQGLQMALTETDLLVVDEAHRTAGSTTKHAALVHDDDVLPAARRLYMTATARVFTNVSRSADTDDASVNSMDDESVFGPVLYRYPFSQAIADGWLDDYRLAVIGVTKAEVLALLRNASGTAAAPTHHTAMVQAALARAANDLGLRRVIAFCPRVKDAREFANTFQNTLSALPQQQRPERPLHAKHINGKMNGARRQRILERLAHPPNDGWSVVSNAKCLSEGIDVPTVDCVAFTAAKKSPIDIVQAIGRALRRDPDGTGIATILVPILLPDSPDDIDHDIDAGDYDVLWQVINGLRAHDDTFATALNECRITGEPSNDLQRRITHNLPDHYQHHQVDFVQHLTIRIIKNTAGQWWEGYRRLAEYHAQRGHTNVRTDEVTEDGYHLGAWAQNVRHSYRYQRLSPDRVAALDKLQFDWNPVTTQAQDRWARGIAAAQYFHAKKGHLRPPLGFIRDGIRLSSWLSVQRVSAASGDLPEDRKAALDALDMDWRIRQPLLSRMPEIQAYYAKHHRFPSSIDPDAHIASLGRVVVTLRRMRKCGELDAETIETLEALGFDWEPQQRPWDDGLTAATEFRDSFGHLLPDQGYCHPNGVKLYVWLGSRRTEYRQGTLKPDRIAALNELGMIWDLQEAEWDEGVAAAAAHYKEFGHLYVSSAYRGVDHRGKPFELHKWLQKVRGRRRNNALTQAQIAQLDDLGMEWNAKEAAWQINLAALTKYRAENGHLTIPPDLCTDEGVSLASVLHTCRSSRRYRKLAPEREAALDALGIDWTPHQPASGPSAAPSRRL